MMTLIKIFAACKLSLFWKSSLSLRHYCLPKDQVDSLIFQFNSSTGHQELVLPAYQEVPKGPYLFIVQVTEQ